MAKQKFVRIPLPGEGAGWTKRKRQQDWLDRDGNVWKQDRLHKDHWDVSDPKSGRKIREIDFNGVQIWPEGPKNKNKRSKYLTVFRIKRT